MHTMSGGLCVSMPMKIVTHPFTMKGDEHSNIVVGMMSLDVSGSTLLSIKFPLISHLSCSLL